MFAGYETTSTMLSYSAHTLAKYQDEQKRLYDEIKEFFDSDNDVINHKEFFKSHMS